jgi:hypothetical protein
MVLPGKHIIPTEEVLMNLKKMLVNGTVSHKKLDEWSVIEGCTPEQVQKSDEQYRTFQVLAFALFLLAGLNMFGLPLLFSAMMDNNDYNRWPLLMFGLVLVAIGLTLLARAPKLHVRFIQDAIELQSAYNCVLWELWSASSIKKQMVENVLKSVARSISHNEIDRERYRAETNSHEPAGKAIRERLNLLMQYDEHIRRKRGEFNRLHSAATKFWKMDSKDHYLRIACDIR